MLNLKLSENKSLWFDIRWRDSFRTIFSWEVSWTRKTDHAGFTVWLALGKLWIELEITDRRHWNFEKDQWFKYGEDMKEPLLIEDECE